MSEPASVGSALTDGLVVEVNDETADGSGDLEPWSRVAEQTLLGEGVSAGRLDVIFVDPEMIAELNREHLGQDRPTDVLAFPLDGPTVGAGGYEPSDDSPPPHLGDVVVCPRVAAEQAPEHAGSIEAELTLLVVHGVLHVLGHDHAEPAETLEMQARERAHLQRHGFEHPVAP